MRIKSSFAVFAALASCTPCHGSKSLPDSSPANPDAYWEREFNTGPQPSSYFQIGVQVADFEIAEAKIDRLIRAAKGKPANQANGFHNGRGSGSTARQFSYQVPTPRGEQTSRSIVDLGTLVQYNVQKNHQSNVLDELDPRIAEISKELREGEGALKTLPAAKALLTRRLGRLKEARDAFLEGKKIAILNISLTLLESKQE